LARKRQRAGIRYGLGVRAREGTEKGIAFDVNTFDDNIFVSITDITETTKRYIVSCKGKGTPYINDNLPNVNGKFPFEVNNLHNLHNLHNLDNLHNLEEISLSTSTSTSTSLSLS